MEIFKDNREESNQLLVAELVLYPPFCPLGLNDAPTASIEGTHRYIVWLVNRTNSLMMVVDMLAVIRQFQCKRAKNK